MPVLIGRPHQPGGSTLAQKRILQRIQYVSLCRGEPAATQANEKTVRHEVDLWRTAALSFRAATGVFRDSGAVSEKRIADQAFGTAANLSAHKSECHPPMGTTKYG